MEKQMEKNQLKQTENQNQQGRSMVEMLGVLVVIGVISLGGIAGYRMAMNRYQANQIANEINLMRTDAQIKIAQGAEELMLGSPYDDEKHLNFNANYGVEVGFEEIETETPGKTEKGYSFTLSNIPAGVCQPLATLLDGMDDTVVLEINGKDYETVENPCSETENEVFVAFSTEDIGVSGGEKKCDSEACDGECTSDGRCVQCTESGKKHWNDEIQACAACGNNSHCSSSKPACIEGVCSACTEDSQCGENGHCTNSGYCLVCGTSQYNAVWNETKKSCDYCYTVAGQETAYWNGNECTACPPEKPYLNTPQKVCAECLNNNHCQKDDGNNYYCETKLNSEYGVCIECPNGWDAEHGCKIGECESNDDCGSGEYCYLRYGYRSTSEFHKSEGFGSGELNQKSECRNAESDKKSGTVNGKTLYTSEKYMTWWAAERFCDALGKRMLKWSDLDWKCYNGEDNTDKVPDPTKGYKGVGYCKKTGEKYGYSNVSDTIKELASNVGGGDFWLGDTYSLTALRVETSDGRIGYYTASWAATGKQYGFDNTCKPLCIDK